MRLPKIVFASALLAFPGIAQAADAPCLTRSEFSALAAYALPSVIEGANARCAQTLGPGAYLSKRGHELVERYAAAEDANWPMAKAAFLKMSAKTDNQANNIMKLLPDETQQEMFGQIIQAMVVQEIPPEHCRTIDEFARLLAPLPAQNTAEILTLIISLAGSSKQGTGKSPMGKLRICQDGK